MTPKMTVTKAWRQIAIAFDTPRKLRTVKQLSITRSGLCLALRELTGLGGNMSRLEAILGGDSFSIFAHYPYLTKVKCVRGDRIRAGVAALLAAMGKKERESLAGYPEC